MHTPGSDDIATLFSQAITLHQAGELQPAQLLYSRILATRPDHFDALHLSGVIALQSGNPARAAEVIGRAVMINPGFADAFSNLDNAQLAIGATEAAVASYDRAITLRPDYADACFNRGAALNALRRHADALADFDRAIALRPGFAEAHNFRGVALLELHRSDAALASFDTAIALVPGFAIALSNRGLALRGLRRQTEALASLDQAIALAPTLVDALANRAQVLRDLKRFTAAAADIDRALACRPDQPYLAALRLLDRAHICDWTGLEEGIAALAEPIRAGARVAVPFQLIPLVDDPALQRSAAETLVRDRYPAHAPAAPAPPPHDRIRIGYYSADFMEHATAVLMAELFELHDRTCFEIIAFSFGVDAPGPTRDRLRAAFDRFIEVGPMADAAVAALSREIGIDIAVDLKGFTNEERMGIFAHRAAPVQVNYLGYPGTSGAPYIDYIIADAVLIPEAMTEHYSEQVIRLPASYQPNDRKRPIAPGAVARVAEGFTFCCFNNSYKIMPAMFDAWMRILHAIEGSVLWLIEDNDEAVANLRNAAAERGIAPVRLIFAPRVLLADHLARHRAADLFLDSWPCNAHTTASDALWAGLPLLTLAGESFAARVAASLLTAVGLPELITHSLSDYERLAIALARDPARLAAIRRQLETNRMTAPLFDSVAHCRALEAAYAGMLGEPAQ